MLYVIEVPDQVPFLETWLKEAYNKVDEIDMVVDLEGIPIKELMIRVDTIEAKVERPVNLECGDNLIGFVAHTEQ